MPGYYLNGAYSFWPMALNYGLLYIHNLFVSLYLLSYAWQLLNRHIYKLLIEYRIQNLWFRSDSKMFMLKIQTFLVVKGILKEELTFGL